MAEVQSRLAVDGLQVGSISEIFTIEDRSGVVITQSPSSGTIVTKGALVDLVVSKGPPPTGAVLVPDFMGLHIEAVEDWAAEAKAKVILREDAKAVGASGTVVRQKPEAGQPLLEPRLVITIVPLLASEQGFRLTYKVPNDIDEADIRIKARSNKGEFNVYKGRHKGGHKIEVPMEIESTTRVRIYIDGSLKQERVIEP